MTPKSERVIMSRSLYAVMPNTTEPEPNRLTVTTLSKSKMRHWKGDKDSFITFLLETLVPDLREDGSNCLVDDFETAIWFMCGGE